MDDWVVWLILAGLLAAGEVLTLGLVLGLVALAAVAGALVALVTDSLALEVLVFAVAAVALLAVVRPIARSHLRTPRQIRTGTAALVGARALVLERVDAHDGRVKIGGEVWSARALDESHVYEPGTTVEVMKIEGATALVYE